MGDRPNLTNLTAAELESFSEPLLSDDEMAWGFGDLDLSELGDFDIDPEPDPAPSRGRSYRRPQDEDGFVKQRMRRHRAKAPRPYTAAERVPMMEFWIRENQLRGTKIPDDVLEMMDTFTPAEERQLIEALDRAEARAAVKPARSRPQDSPERVYRP